MSLRHLFAPPITEDKAEWKERRTSEQEHAGTSPLVFRKAKSKARGLCRVAFCQNRSRKGATLCPKHTMQKWRKDNPIRAAYWMIKGRARKKGLEFSLTLDDFVDFCKKTGYLTVKGVHLDRKDATEGYHLWNIQPLGGSENISKGNRERWTQKYKDHIIKRKADVAAKVAAAAAEEEGDPF